MSIIREIVENERGLPVRGLKNLIINGGFNVWQRGTSFTYGTKVYGYRTADRMYSSNSGNAGGQFTMLKSEIDGSNSIKIKVNTAVSDLTGPNYWFGVRYRFEGQDLYTLAKQGKTLTLSFLFNSNVVGEYPICFRNWTDSTTNIESYVTTFNYTTANVAQKVEVQIPLNHTFSPALLNNTNLGIELTLGFLNQENYITDVTDTWQTVNYLTTSSCVNWGATADNFIEIAELQLEEGSVATPFEHRPYALELNLCQRYYKEDSFICVRVTNSGNFVGQSPQSISFALMRSKPTFTFILLKDEAGDGQNISTLSGTIGTDIIPHNDNLSAVGHYTTHLVKMDAEP